MEREATWSELTGKSNTGHQYIRNYDFDYDLPPPLGLARGGADFTMTAVLGHLTSTVSNAYFLIMRRSSYTDAFHELQSLLSWAEEVVRQGRPG
jgi:hypothetical protein